MTTPSPDAPPAESSSASAHAPIQPLQNPKYRHISRSAAKRESVQLLGSIRDLQLHFSQSGAVSHRSGPGAGIGVPGLGGISEGDENVPPGSFPRSEKRERRPWKEVSLPRIGADQARSEARGAVGRLKTFWGIVPTSAGLSTSPSTTTGILSPTTPGGRKKPRDAGVVLVETARTIRRVRDLSLSTVPAAQRKVSAPALSSKRQMKFSTPSRPSGVGLPRAVSYAPLANGARPDGEDMLGELRKAALEVLAGLRVLEENLRITNERDDNSGMAGGDTLDDADQASTRANGESSRAVDLGQSTTLSRNTTIDEYDEDDDYSINALSAPQEETKEPWEERIALDQREYRDIDTETERVEGVREAVRRWVGVVERLFGVKEGGAGQETWAREDWAGREQDRLRAFLLAHLPATLLDFLPPRSMPDSHETILSSLSDGYILTQAYNAAIASSPKPWGYIPAEDVHDTLRRDGDEGDEGKMDKEWTFRRVANLTCWAAALRLRYHLPVYMPVTTAAASLPAIPTETPLPALATPARPARRVSPSSVQTRTLPSRQNSAQRIDFDPLVVAKKAEGWDATLTTLLYRWIEETAREAREGEEEEAGGGGRAIC